MSRSERVRLASVSLSERDEAGVTMLSQVDEALSHRSSMRSGGGSVVSWGTATDPARLLFSQSESGSEYMGSAVPAQSVVSFSEPGSPEAGHEALILDTARAVRSPLQPQR